MTTTVHSLSAVDGTTQVTALLLQRRARMNLEFLAIKSESYLSHNMPSFTTTAKQIFTMAARFTTKRVREYVEQVFHS